MHVSYSQLRDEQPAPGPVNLNELREVRQHHMPAASVRFATPCQLRRVADEVASQYPHLREEAAFVVADELTRRDQRAQSPLTVTA